MGRRKVIVEIRYTSGMVRYPWRWDVWPGHSLPEHRTAYTASNAHGYERSAKKARKVGERVAKELQNSLIVVE
jgi:hypothetical protein